MGIFSFFGQEKAIEATGGLIKETGNAFDKLFTSDEERQAGKVLMEKIRQRPMEWAHELNVINAKSLNWFNSGWRPALGWVGAVSLFFFFVPQYVVASFLWVKACLGVINAEGAIGALPAYPVSADGLWELIALLIGGAGIRTYEKIQGVNRN